MNTQATDTLCDKAKIFSDQNAVLERLSLLLNKLGIEVNSRIFSGGKLKQVSRSMSADPILAQIISSPQVFLNELASIDADQRPATVIFAKDYDNNTISAAVQAGADAYLTEEPNPVNVSAAIRFARANHAAKIELKKALRKTQRRLGERAEIERAKYHLMLDGDMTEAQAHTFLRTIAMRECTTMGATAKKILEIKAQ